MPGKIDFAAVSLFAKMFEHETQKMVDELANTCVVDRWEGGNKRYQVLEDEDYTEKSILKMGDAPGASDRLRATVRTEADYRFRWMFTVPYELTNWWDIDDEFDIGDIENPQGSLMQKFKKAYARQTEKTKIDALVNDAIPGDGNKGNLPGAPVALPDTQIIAANWQPGDPTGAAAGTGAASTFSLDKLRFAKRVFDDADVDDDDRFLAYSPASLESLLYDPEVTSSDFHKGQVQGLYDGNVHRYMGFNFRRTTRLPISANVRTNIAYTKRATKFNPGRKRTEFDELPDWGYAKQLFSHIRLGAVRMYDTEVLHILADESTAPTP